MMRRRTAPTLPLFSAITLTVAALAVFTGCPTGVDWDDYEETNLVGPSTLADFFFQGGLLAGTEDPVTGETAATNYVRWEATGVAPPDGIAGSVYRYEVVNLFPNGDFEQGTLSDTGWVDVPDGSFTTQASLTATALAGEQSLKLAFERNTVRYTINLAETLADGFVTGAKYSFHYLVQTATQSFGNEVNDNDAAVYPQGIYRVNRGNNPDEIYEVPTPGATLENDPGVVLPTSVIVADTNYTWFSFGGFSEIAQSVSIQATVDDLRFIRSDRGHYARLAVPLNASGRPKLKQQGSYFVSVWVRGDPTAGSGNRFTPSFIALGIDSRPEEPGGEYANRIDLEDTSTWTQYTTQINGFDFPSINVDGDTVILEMLVEIGDSQAGPTYAIPGSLLVAGPFLEWSPKRLENEDETE